MSDKSDNLVDKVIDFENVIYDIDKVVLNIISDFSKYKNNYNEITNIKNQSLSYFNFILQNIK